MRSFCLNISWLNIKPQGPLRRVSLYHLSGLFLPKLRLTETAWLAQGHIPGSVRVWRRFGLPALIQSYGPHHGWRQTDKTLILKPFSFFECQVIEDKNHYLFQFRYPNIRKLLFFMEPLYNHSFVCCPIPQGFTECLLCAGVYLEMGLQIQIIRFLLGSTTKPR